MLVWTEFCQEMFACLEECELAMLALSHSCQRDCSQGKVQKPFGGGRCRTERVTQLQPHTLLECHGGYEGKRCLLSLSWPFKLRGGTWISFTEWARTALLLAGGAGSKQINSQFEPSFLHAIMFLIAPKLPWPISVTQQLCRHRLSSPTYRCFQTRSLCRIPVNGSWSSFPF